MKKNIVIVLMFLGLISNISAQNIVGKWSGELNVAGNKLTIAFGISKSDNNTFHSFMDSPNQGAFGIKCESTTFENSTVQIKLPNFGISYSGVLKNDSSIVGTFKQSGMEFPLNLTKVLAKNEKPARPQEPKEPYPYYSEDVTFVNKKANIKLAGTLTLPNKNGRYPAVVLISGSGAQNRDEELMAHKPFLVISDFLTKNGIAVLRFDDRGTAQSEGDFASATTLDFATDVESALDYLKTRTEIDKQNLGLIGHSEGGIIAPIVATKRSDVAFIILLAGTGLAGDKILQSQQALAINDLGVSEAEKEEICNQTKAVMDIAKQEDDVKIRKEKIINFLKEQYSKLGSENLDAASKDVIGRQASMFLTPWMHYFIKHDPAKVLERVKCPVLALNGEKDVQVLSKENLPAIEKALIKGGNKDVTIREFANLNHLFQECKTGRVDEYVKIEQTFSPIALSAIIDWINAILKK